MNLFSYEILRKYASIPLAFRRFFVIGFVLLVLNLISISRFLYSHYHLGVQSHWRDLLPQTTSVFLLCLWLYGMTKARRLGLMMSDIFVFSPFLGWCWEAVIQVRGLFSNIEKGGASQAQYLLFIWYMLVLLLCGFAYHHYVWRWWLAQREHLVFNV